MQLTPPGSACSVVLGQGITEMPPGSQRGIQMVVADARAAQAELRGRGVEVTDLDEMDWGTSSSSPILTATPGHCRNCPNAASDGAAIG